LRQLEGRLYGARHIEGLDARFDLAENDQPRVGYSLSILAIKDC
jgi:hypothetical protein